MKSHTTYYNNFLIYFLEFFFTSVFFSLPIYTFPIVICSLGLFMIATYIVINPRRACARVTVLVLSVCLSVCLCVCVCVCFPYSGTSRNQAYKQQYQRLQCDTGMKYKKGFFFKTLRSEVMASFTHLE